MKKIIANILAIMTAIVSIYVLGSSQPIDPILETATAITKNIIQQDIESQNERVVARYLKGLDGSEDYVMVVGETGGYAIFDKEDMELIELSETGKTPYQTVNAKDIYYGGPTIYYQEKNNVLRHVQTNEEISENHKENIANNLKIKLKEEKENRKRFFQNQVDLENDTISSVLKEDEGCGADKEGNLIEEDTINVNMYQALAAQYVSDYEFFLQNPTHGENTGVTCGIVAAQLLLTYNNWSKDGRLISGSNFFFPNYHEVKAQPYHKSRISTTSEGNEADGVKAFYEQLLDSIVWTKEKGTTISAIKAGILKYVDVDTKNWKDTRIII